MAWTRGITIGRGSTATVSIATLNGQAFAVKSAELWQSELLQKEQRILSKLSCPHIVAYKGYEVTQENGKLLYNIFLEYAAGGTVIDAIRRHGGLLDEAMIRSYTREILLGLQHLHSNGIVHSDIKGQNILVTSDGAKIADLGCARLVGDLPEKKTPIAGTPAYMAPEVARGEHQGFPADVWALGCTVLEMATGKSPWMNFTDPVSALYHIGFSGNVLEIPSSMSKQGKDFLSKCLIKDPKERWSASELLKHDFITEMYPNTNYCNLDTPTSVLDQGVWDSREEEEELNVPEKTCSSHFPLKRIEQLAQCTYNMPNWESNNSWVTVRSKDNWVSKDISLDSSLVYATEGTSEGNFVLVSAEYNFINILPNVPTTIGGISTLNTNISGGCSNTVTIHKLLFRPFVPIKQDLSISSNFENEIIRVLFLTLKLLHILPFLFMDILCLGNQPLTVVNLYYCLDSCHDLFYVFYFLFFMIKPITKLWISKKKYKPN